MYLDFGKISKRIEKLHKCALLYTEQYTFSLLFVLDPNRDRIAIQTYNRRYQLL